MSYTMHSASQSSHMERREGNLPSSQLWDRLTLSQQFSASSLNQYGFNLAFIRNTNDGPLAILFCEDNTATIDNHGEINTSPDIIIR